MEDEQQHEAPKPRKQRTKQLRNTRSGTLVIGNHKWAPGEAKELTTDERKAKRVEHAIRTGVLVEE